MDAEQATTHDHNPEEEPELLLPRVHHLTREEAHSLFDENAQYYLGISGEEFKRRWDAGEYEHNDDSHDHSSVWNVAILIPMVEDEP